MQRDPDATAASHAPIGTRYSRLTKRITFASFTSGSKTDGDLKSGPFVFIATNGMRAGMLEDDRQRVRQFCAVIEVHEPRLLAFIEYPNADNTEASVVQVHLDVESMSST